MAFTVEDGSGVADANSYVEVADADAYFADRGVAAWIGADAVKQGALVRATDFVEKRNLGKWRGVKLGAQADQSLAWPRDGAVDDDGFDLTAIPKALSDAVCEYALRALGSSLDPDPATGPNVNYTRSKVGPIEEETHYATGATQIKPYPAADALLRGLKRKGGRVIRA